MRSEYGLLRCARNDVEYTFAFSRRIAPEVCVNLVPPKSEGAGNAGRRLAPAVSCAGCSEMRTRAYRYSQSSPAFPAQWFDGLYRALPGDELPFASIAAGLTAGRTRLDSNSLRQLDTSHGCQNHTALPYASAPVVCTLCSLTDESPPCEHHHAPDAAASTATRPNVRDDGQRPSGGTGWQDLYG
jgi:hypothetical protein